MARAITQCPGCGHQVTPFAAGCAICGADLDAARAKSAARRQLGLPRPTWLRGRPGVDWVQIAVALIVALAAPPIGFLLCVFWALQRHRAGEPLMVGAMLAAAALAIAALLGRVWFWSHLLGI